jgi:hypothetical protein
MNNMAWRGEGMRRKSIGRPGRIMGTVLVVTLSVCGVASCAACGTENESVAGRGVTTTSATAVTDASGAETAATDAVLSDDAVRQDSAMASTFALVAKEMAPLPAYSPTYLPAGAELAVQWWPLVDCSTPEEYSGPPTANPRIDFQDESAVSAQVVVRCPVGWLAVLQNFRGDLGDTPSEDAGLIQGHDARVYDVEGATVVQWSDEGCWYAVIGRDVPQAEVVKVAMAMEKTPAGFDDDD